MTPARFIQIHSLHGYSAVLLNRDDSGLAKRINYGGKNRTRISSQCLKRHWRTADSPHGLNRIDGVEASVRSRETVTRRVIAPLLNEGHDEKVVAEIEKTFQVAVYGDKAGTPKNRQPLLLGEPEIEHLSKEARKIAEEAAGDAAAAKKAAEAWKKGAKENMKALRKGTRAPGGIAAALFGRMVTADVEANIDAAIHVAHAFTVHVDEAENDYFTVVDDLQPDDDDSGAAHIGETEISSGLFYGYVVVDRKMLLDNLGGADDVADDVTRRLIHLIATVSPGAKHGPTAPYSYADWMLVEAGERQPRSLAGAFRKPCKAAPRTEAQERAHDYLAKLDAMYGAEEARRVASLDGGVVPNAVRVGSVDELATWAGTAMRTGEAA